MSAGVLGIPGYTIEGSVSVLGRCLNAHEKLDCMGDCLYCRCDGCCCGVLHDALWMAASRLDIHPINQSVKPTPIRIDRCPRCGVTLRERSLEKNARLHAVLGAISKQKQWAGKWLDIEAWKRLMVAAYERANGRQAEFYPALDGQGFDVVYRRTSRMSEEEIREVCYFAEAWAIENGVKLEETQALCDQARA